MLVLSASPNAAPWYDDAWLVSLASIFLTALLAPILAAGVRWLQARRGQLTGSFLLLSELGDRLLVERMHCLHIGQSVRGSIDHLGEASITDLKAIRPGTLKRRYKFYGTAAFATFLGTYWLPRRTADEAGTLVFRERRPDIFVGYLTGFSRQAADDGVHTAESMMIRIDRRLARATSPSSLGLTVEALLRVVPNPWHQPERQPPQLVKINYMLSALIWQARQDLMVARMAGTTHQSVRLDGEPDQLDSRPGGFHDGQTL
jgi:hypothetical protein